MRKPGIKTILFKLVAAYGDRTWQKRLEPVDELVLTILSQNTSDINSRRAFKSLIENFAGWDKVASAESVKIAGAIRAGGLADVKAKYIKNALLALQKAAPGFDLQFLARGKVRDSREWLLRLPGVGMKTASCVLLFALGMPAFPVDTHVYRVVKRLGLIRNRLSADAAHLEMEKLTPPGDIYRCHVLLIEHGRKTCKAQRPLCSVCCLAGICPSREY
ncbi:MAG: endonuclease III [Chloroflexi bacterium]|nr:endonuclease III [Chloroflexota bacterium]